jgi:hypothetical protein
MPGQSGTLETIARHIGLALQPLKDRLASDHAIDLLAELGLEFPPQLLQPAFVNALNSGATAAGALPATITQLTNAIDGDNEGQILTSGAQLIEEIAAVTAALAQIGNELKNLAGALPGMSASEVSSFADALPGRLLGYLLISYLEAVAPGAVSIGNLLGILDYLPNAGVDGDAAHPGYIVRQLQFSNLGDLLTSPDKLLKNLYGWGNPGFDGKSLISRLSTSLGLLGVSSQVSATGDSLSVFLLTLGVASSTNPPGLSATFGTTLPSGLDLTLPFSDTWSIHVQAKAALASGLQVTIKPPANVTLRPPSGTVNGLLQADIIAQGADASHPIIIIGQTGGSRLQTDSFTFGMGVKITWDSGSGTATAEPTVQIAIKGGKVVIDMSNADDLYLNNLREGKIKNSGVLTFIWI